MDRFVRVFGRGKSAVIGMVHVAALPGSPGARLSIDEIVSKACEEANIYNSAKLDGILVENMHDVPWQRPDQLGPETTAVMSVVCSAIRRLHPRLPVGVQILSCGNRQALAVAKAAGLEFIRAEGWVFGHIGDEGYTESCAGELTRYRRQIGADDVLIFTDIKKKHSAHSLTSDVSLSETVEAAELFLSDGVVVTGSATGVATDVQDLAAACDAVRHIPVLVGSGVDIRNVDQYMTTANALIVGSHFKVDGDWRHKVDCDSVTRFMERVDRLRTGPP